MIKPGTDYAVTIMPSNILNVTYTCSGVAVVPDEVVNLGNGKYEVKIAGSDITCPGPLRITEGTTILVEEAVGPCP